MPFKQIIFFGTTVITTVIIIAFLMYYYNQDACPKGTFFCTHTVSCIPYLVSCIPEQSLSSEDIYDDYSTNISHFWYSNSCFSPWLKNNDNFDCLFIKNQDSFGNLYNSDNERSLIASSHQTPLICKSSDCPKNCKCEKCAVTCDSYFVIPHNVSPNVTKLTLNNNLLTRLSIDNFRRYKKLESLSLKFNNIKSIQNDTFANSGYLQSLILSNNNLKEILQGQLSGLRSLEKLSADNNYLTRVDFSDFTSNYSLKWLDLSNNNLASGRTYLFSLQALEYLNFSHNKLVILSEATYFPSNDYEQLSKFKRPTVNNFEIFRGLSNLRCLDLSNNKLVMILPGAFDGLRSLKKFLAIDNLLQSVNFKDFENSTTLEKIDLSNNELIYENLKFWYQPGLKELILNQNLIDIMTDSFLRKFPNLKFLSLKRNHVCYISSDVFKNLKNLVELNVSYNKLKRLPIDLFLLSSNLTALDLSYNNLTPYTIYFTRKHNGVLCLDFSGNEIDYISQDLLNYFPKLKYLNLEKNKIGNISSGAFRSFAELVDLNLSGNELRDLPDDLFHYNLRLQILNLSFNKLKYLREELFSPLTHLTTLKLGFNLIQSFKFEILNSAVNLHTLDLDDITIEDDKENALNRFQQLSIIIFKTLRYCQIYGINIRTCRPETNGVSSLSDLLSKPLLRVAVWGISGVTILGNILVLCGRFIYKDENRVLSIVIRNLAIADMLMGVYLLAIGLEDFNLRDMYNKEANKWISSWRCTFLGMIAMISCEVSVLILSFMSIERYIVIAAPFNKAPNYFTCRSVATSMIIIWIIGILLSVIPGIYWRESTRFYGLNGMCFPLHIDDAFMIGWQYSAFVFLGINLLGLIIIGSVYLGMFYSIRRIRHNTPLTIRDSEIALRFFFIVLTDALCSAPVILLKIFALQNYPISPHVHAWVVVFILPVNGAINPILYTFTVPKFKEQLSEYCFGRI